MFPIRRSFHVLFYLSYSHFIYRNGLHFNMADDALVLILKDHGERLTSIESDVHDIRTGIEQIKDSPIFAIERYVRRKVAQTGGVIGLVLFAFMAFTQ